FSPESPNVSRGGSRCSLFRGTNLAKIRRNRNPTEPAHDCSSVTRRSRVSTFLNEMRTSRPKRSTQPSSIVQSLWEFVPSASKSRSNAGSIHPKFISFVVLQPHTSNRYRATDRLPVEPALLNCRIVEHRRTHPDAAG